ncbi:hypothetical protein [Humisphaera borealis]|uniref:Core-binding (CB) domain-containing protein n=1 Tax=Humisphaera borealis TaxID=2807512 RepID=A0A7M2WQ48_9BACT|nr:hypothetical protein [Humisphaera borealis]QOV87647.1 hypothetical protein IPV69_15275 [Humisphaera borealis]
MATARITGKSAGKSNARSIQIPSLKRHRNGQWFMTKRLHGVKKFYYFGCDQAEAHAEYLRQVPDILAGRQPGTVVDASTVEVLQLADRFVEAQAARVKYGEIGARHFDDMRRAAEFFVQWAGEQTPAGKIPPLSGFRSFLMARMKLHAFSRNVTHARAMLKWAYRHKPALLPSPLHEDDALAKARAKHIRRERRENEAENGLPIYQPHECRAQVRAAAKAGNWELLSFILLGLNAGMGQTHIAMLPKKPIDFDSLYVDWVRTKTEEICQFTLWPITAAALKLAIARRPKPKNPAMADQCFIHPSGNLWAQVFIGKVEASPGAIGSVAPNDEIGKMHRLLEDGLKVADGSGDKGGERPMKRPGRAFYAFRRTFSTNANDVPDKDAIRRTMGHSLTGNDPSYVRAIPVERLRAVTDYVHRKLFFWSPEVLLRVPPGQVDQLFDDAFVGPPAVFAEAPAVVVSAADLSGAPR